MGEPSTVGKRLRAFRERAGLSQNQLAQLSGVTRTSIIFLENGRRQDITTQTAILLADALGISVDELIRGDRLGSECAAAGVEV
jgi:transcriptional regulator with XRE-family HTH domain